MKKRSVLKAIPAFLLALLLICPLLTACRNNGGGGDNTSGGTSGGTGTNSPDTTVVTLPDTESGKLLQTFIDAAYASGSGLTALDDNAKKLVAVWSEVAADADAVMNSVYTQFASGDVSYERICRHRARRHGLLRATMPRVPRRVRSWRRMPTISWRALPPQ